MMVPMVSMELDDDEITDTVLPIPTDAPRYPYGLCITLTKAEFDKLGIDPSVAQVGGLVQLNALARITSYSCNETQNGEDCRCELQIEDLGIPSDDEEAEGEAPAPVAQKKSLYRPMKTY